MAVFWLHQLHPLAPSNPSMDVGLRTEVLRILTLYAGWPSDKYPGGLAE